MTSPERTALLQIHVCVVLWGFTAILGKLIALPALALVWWRMALVTGALLLLPRVWRGVRAMGPRLLAAYAGIGVLVALHWLTFYGAIKLANASVAVTCIALAPVFVAVTEPLLTGRRFALRELLLGVAVVPGVALVVGGIPGAMHAGLWIGVASAALVAVFGALNKRIVDRADALSVTALELGVGAAFLVPAALLVPLLAGLLPAPLADLFDVLPWTLPGQRDALWLALLAFGCTLLPFALSLVALRQLSAFGAQMAVNLEPVYAIALASLLFAEQQELSPRFYLGVLIVLAAVFAQPLLQAGRLRAAPAEPAPPADPHVVP